MIRLNQHPQPLDVAPQAIFWRPVSYFSEETRTEEDDLDTFCVASFDLGNRLTYDIRHYRADPEFTSTLYLPLALRGENAAKAAIGEVVEASSIPQYAVAWQRGEDFQYGVLERRSRDRLREDEARTLILKVAAREPDNTASIAKIRRELPRLFELSAADLKPSSTRNGEQMWQQIVRNVVSHQEGTRSIFRRGLASRRGERITVTEKGIAHLNSIGFSSTA